MSKPKESVMRRILSALGIVPKGPTVKELEARADLIVARRKAKRATKREAVAAGA